MQLTLKNNNIYYYHYRILNGELSFLLIILLMIILFFCKNLIKYISYICVCIPIIGTYDAYLRYKKYDLMGILLFGILFHLLFFYPLIDFKKYFKPNILQLVILILSLLIVNFLPYWPYLVSRKDISLLILIIYLILGLYYIKTFGLKI